VALVMGYRVDDEEPPAYCAMCGGEECLVEVDSYDGLGAVWLCDTCLPLEMEARNPANN
jgi:hypothetical protein